MKVHYIACAASSSVDAKTNKLSLFHVLDEIGADAFPVRLASFCVAALFERAPDEPAHQTYQMATILDGALIASFTMTIDFARGRRNRSVNTINGLSIPKTGTLIVRLSQKAEVLADWTLAIIQIGAPSTAAPERAPNEAKPATPTTRAVVN